MQDAQSVLTSENVEDEVKKSDYFGRLKFLVGHQVRHSLGMPSEDSWGHKLANSWLFHALGLFLTLLNCGVVAFEVGRKTSNALGIAGGGQREEGLDDVLDVCVQIRRAFIGWVAIEVFVQFLASRAEFFVGRHRWWNLYDVVVLLVSLFEFVASSPRLSFIRFLRVARSSRAVQAIRSVRYSPSLQKMMTSIGAVLVSLCWAACLLFVLIYMAGVMMMEGVVFFVDDVMDSLAQRPDGSSSLFAGAGVVGGADLLQDLQTYYGSVSRTFTTLFRAITGADWSPFAAPLATMGWGWSVVWLVYIFLASLGMLNILTGIIVDILKKPVPNERLLHLDAEAREAKQLSKMFAAELARLGRHGPEDTLSGPRFNHFVKRPLVVRQLREFGIDMEQLQANADVFHLIDLAHAGALTADQAAWGFLRLRDEARASDLIGVERRLMDLSRDIRDVGTEISWVRDAITVKGGGSDDERDIFHM